MEDKWQPSMKSFRHGRWYDIDVQVVIDEMDDFSFSG